MAKVSLVFIGWVFERGKLSLQQPLHIFEVLPHHTNIRLWGYLAGSQIIWGLHPAIYFPIKTSGHLQLASYCDRLFKYLSYLIGLHRNPFISESDPVVKSFHLIVLYYTYIKGYNNKNTSRPSTSPHPKIWGITTPNPPGLTRMHAEDLSKQNNVVEVQFLTVSIFRAMFMSCQRFDQSGSGPIRSFRG